MVPETENSLIPTASPCRLGFWGTQLVQVFLEIILYLWKGANESPGLLVGPIVHTLNSILQEIGNSVIFSHTLIFPQCGDPVHFFGSVFES